MLIGPHSQRVYGVAPQMHAAHIYHPFICAKNAIYIAPLFHLFMTKPNLLRMCSLWESRVIVEGSLCTVCWFYTQRLTSGSSREPLPLCAPCLKRPQQAYKQLKILLTKSKRAFISIWWEARHRRRPLEWSRCQRGNIGWGHNSLWPSLILWGQT